MDHKQPDHANGSPASRGLLIEAVNVLGKDYSNDEMAGAHANSTHGKNRLATQTVDPEDCRNGCNEHDNTDHTSGQQTCSCLTKAKLSKDLGRVV